MKYSRRWVLVLLVLVSLCDRLAEFEATWGAKYPSIAARWRRHWQEIISMFAFPPEIRRLLYTTNAIESLHRSLRKIIKTRGHFPNDQAASKLLYLALRNIEKGWKAAPKEMATRSQSIRYTVRRPLDAKQITKQAHHDHTQTI